MGIIKGTALEGAEIPIMARVTNLAGSLITQATIVSIAYKVFDKLDAALTDIAQSSPLTVADVVFNSLQTDDSWTKDSAGYNFRYVTDPAELPEGGATYRFEFTLTTSDGSKIEIVAEVDTLNMLGE